MSEVPADVTGLPELRELIGDCTRCPLSKARTNLVFGAGDPHARLMFIGEAPGRVEDMKGLPFVGPAGALLDEMLEGIGLVRDEVYIGNVVKCRPPGNRDPQPLEMDTCGLFLERQIEIIDPDVICALGRIASGRLLGREVQITKMHGQKFTGHGHFIVPVFHPAAALRTPQTRTLLKEDFDSLRRYLDLDEAPPEPPAPEPEQMGLF